MQVEKDIASALRDIVTFHRERDYPEVGIATLPSTWKFSEDEVCVVEVHNGDTAYFHACPACPIDNQPDLFLVASGSHMMQGNPTAPTTDTDWGDGAESVHPE